MILKSLELNGFKSFPDKTVLSFDRGSTIVVGPNGSGKSNISDAMRWVLGEISSRNIRGTKMEDVIFGGTDKRRQMSFAEVSVTFDNTEEAGRADIPYDEVTVTRKYFRSGDSEYYINRKPVRLKDIHELFMNTGVGRTGYSIIGQGRIAEIISLKSEERRGIFEEAAGIAKYKYKKNEAEKKLAGVNDNLTRANDIVSELASRVGPLEKEAEKARKYLEYYEVKKRADISLWIYDIDRITAESKKAADAYAVAREELEGLEETIASLEAQNERSFKQSQENKMEYERFTALITSAMNELHELDSSSKVAQNNIAHRETMKRLRTEEIENLELKLTEANSATESAKEEVARVSSLLDALLAEENEAEKKRLEFKERISEYESRIDGKLEKYKSDGQTVIEFKLRTAALETVKNSGDAKENSLVENIEKYRDDLALIENRIEKSEKTVYDYDEKINSAKALCSETDEKRAKLEAERETLKGESNNCYIELNSKEHRISALKRMDELLEGYSQSVRFVMNEYAGGAIDGAGNIYGPLSKLITTESEYSLAVETALGANLQNIVVDNESTAKAAMRHLKYKNAGRATFYPVSSMKARTSPISTSEAGRYRGFRGIATEVLKFDPKFAQIVCNLLGATLLFDNIDNATAMAKATGYKVRIVTLDGQIINAGGSFTGGSAKRESGILTRGSESEHLEAEVKKLKQRLEEINSKLGECENKIEQLNRDSGTVRSNLAIIESLRNAEATQLEVLKSQAESDRRTVEGLENDLRELGESVSKSGAECEELVGKIAELEAEMSKLSEERLELDSEKYELEYSLEKLEKESADRNIKAAEIRRDAENLQALQSEREERAGEIVSSIAEAREAIAALDRDNANAENVIEDDRVRISELEGKLTALESERTANSERGREIEKKLMELRERLRENNDRKENVVREYTKLEGRRATLDGELDKMTSRLWDEYELTYTTALECGYERLTGATRAAAAAEQTEYRNKIKGLGSVNVNAVEEYASVKERYDFLSGQVADLEKSRGELLEIIEKLEGEMREVFIKAFDEINKNFRIVFRELFGGGEAELSLSDPENVLTCGIEIRVAPPGKIIKSLMLLSGGEQSFVAIALIFAILRVNLTPFCIFDEIEAALDEANVFRFADYIKRYSDRNQFIVITHRRPTMEIADKLYGVTMYEKGISKILSLEVGEIEEKVGIKA